MAPASLETARAWLEQAADHGTTTDAALRVFDTLPAVALEEMRGRWRGAGLHTGHSLDGLLEAYGWFGKAFDNHGNADPLLFGHSPGVTAIDPRWLPVAAFGCSRLARSRAAIVAFRLARPLLATRQPQARLRMVTYRGVASAAMIYDRKPIIDIFRRIAPATVLGLMDMRDQPPFFFTLYRID